MVDPQNSNHPPPQASRDRERDCRLWEAGGRGAARPFSDQRRYPAVLSRNRRRECHRLHGQPPAQPNLPP